MNDFNRQDLRMKPITFPACNTLPSHIAVMWNSEEAHKHTLTYHNYFFFFKAVLSCAQWLNNIYTLSDNIYALSDFYLYCVRE